MKKLVSLAFYFLFQLSAYSQNLVNNYSLEGHVFCPSTGHQLNYATGWVASLNSPDYFNACANGLSNYGVPSNELGYQYAATGNAYAGALCYGGFAPALIPDLREFCTTTLSLSLSIGVKYYVSFKTVLANTSSHAVNNIGVKFLMLPGVQFPISNNAQVYTTTVINDTLNWTIVQGSFIADTNYNYISIGNHYNDSNTAVTYLQPVTMGHYAYYLIDDVCVSTNSLTCNATTGINDLLDNKNVIVYPNPFTQELNVQSLKSNVTEPSIIKVVDIFGRQMYSNTSAALNFRLQTLNWPNGIYVLEVIKDKERIVRKVVKQ